MFWCSVAFLKLLNFTFVNVFVSVFSYVTVLFLRTMEEILNILNGKSKSGEGSG
jgi:hypothetical protein